MAKVYAISGDKIMPLISGYGGCIAPDTITVDGRRVAFCYRENPHNPLDSGWRFFAGSETDEYLADSQNSGVYDVNTIANYDPDIIPFLDAPPGSAFERENGIGAFGAVEFDAPTD